MMMRGMSTIMMRRVSTVMLGGGSVTSVLRGHELGSFVVGRSIGRGGSGGGRDRVLRNVRLSIFLFVFTVHHNFVFRAGLIVRDPLKRFCQVVPTLPRQRINPKGRGWGK